MSAVKPSQRFRLRCSVDRFPDFQAPAGLTGIVVATTPGIIAGRMDKHLAGAEEWGNEIWWNSDKEFVADAELLIA